MSQIKKRVPATVFAPNRLEALIDGKLPPKGTVISHSARALCYECPRVREEKKIKKFYNARFTYSLQRFRYCC